MWVRTVIAGTTLVSLAVAVAGCAPAPTLPPDKQALESAAAAFRSSGPSVSKPAGTGGPVIFQTDSPPETGLLGQLNAPVAGGVFTPTNAWAGWTSATTYVQVYAGESPDRAGHGLMFVIRRPGIDGQHLDPEGSPSALEVSPPTEGGRLTIDRVEDGKLIVHDLAGTELTFDPVSARFIP